MRRQGPTQCPGVKHIEDDKTDTLIHQLITLKWDECFQGFLMEAQHDWSWETRLSTHHSELIAHHRPLPYYHLLIQLDSAETDGQISTDSALGCVGPGMQTVCRNSFGQWSQSKRGREKNIQKMKDMFLKVTPAVHGKCLIPVPGET